MDSENETVEQAGNGAGNRQREELERNRATGPFRRPAPNLPPPKAFDGTAAAWPRWRQRFQHYRTASGLAHCSEQEQVSVFLYTMGDAADDILSTMEIDQCEASLQEILTALNKYYDARKKHCCRTCKI
ncbi:hypothetical protein BaRGS_00034670 [Batillaria attramentaria]|uniref:Gag protein n=1 Tax=Batillaria attramentaria TaxID=370345 RepID=A0ABD0JGL5_9CAEN